MKLGPGKLVSLYRVARLTSDDYSIPRGELCIPMAQLDGYEPDAFEVQWITRGGLSAPVLATDLEHVSEIHMPIPDPPEPTDLQKAIAELTHDDWAVIWRLTVGASPDIYAAELETIRKRYPSERLPHSTSRFTQPYAAWCKVQTIVTELARGGSRESPVPEAFAAEQTRSSSQAEPPLPDGCLGGCDSRGGRVFHADGCPNAS
jgi:hypothetical protein